MANKGLSKIEYLWLESRRQYEMQGPCWKLGLGWYFPTFTPFSMPFYQLWLEICMVINCIFASILVVWSKMPFFISVQKAFSVFECIHPIAFYFTMVQPIEKCLCAFFAISHILNLTPSNNKYIPAIKSYWFFRKWDTNYET